MGPLQTWKQDGRPLGPHAAVRESETGEQAGTHRRSSERRPEQPRTHPAPRGRVWAGTSNAPPRRYPHLEPVTEATARG